MSYLVLARKYRPNTFSEVAGQEHVTRTLANSIERDKVGHAYLFCGPRGVGKTSIARIFAKSLNCQQGPTAKPCGKCTNCKEVTEGRSLAVQEIDGASHNSVDNVRELIESFRSAPPPGSKYKIYIIDEVHMLSLSAFNALLKSLEEPPPNTVFILATTEVHKIPDTVLSRCQRHNFKALPVTVVRDCLIGIAKQEKLVVEDEVFSMIARLSDGSMRDAQTLLDRVQSYCQDKITAVEASEVLSAVDRSVLFSLSQAIFAHDPQQALVFIGQAFARGVDTNLFLREFVSHWRELLIATIGADKSLAEIGVSSADQSELLRQVASQNLNDLQDLVQIAREGADHALRSSYPKYALEALVVRMATRPSVMEFGQLISELKQFNSNPTARIATSSQASFTTTAKTVPQKALNSEIVNTTATQANVANSLDWRQFVNQSASSEARMLVEQLKRLSPIEFTPGILKAKGPDLCLSYFKEPNNLDKLKVILNNFQKANWVIDLLDGQSVGLAEPGSIIETEQSDKKQRIQKQTMNLSSHPTVQSLKKIFPGSTVESVKIKT